MKFILSLVPQKSPSINPIRIKKTNNHHISSRKSVHPHQSLSNLKTINLNSNQYHTNSLDLTSQQNIHQQIQHPHQQSFKNHTLITTQIPSNNQFVFSIKKFIENSNFNTNSNALNQKEIPYEYLYEIALDLRNKQPFYISNINPSLNNQLRYQIIKLILKIGNIFKFKSNTLFVAINIVDRVIGLITLENKVLEIIAISSLLISSKVEQILIPKIELFIKVSQMKRITKNEILCMESYILQTINFNVSYPSPLYFIEMMCLNQQLFSNDIKRQAIKLAQVTLLSSIFTSYKPSIIALGCLYISSNNYEDIIANNQLQQCIQHIINVMRQNDMAVSQ